MTKVFKVGSKNNSRCQIVESFMMDMQTFCKTKFWLIPLANEVRWIYHTRNGLCRRNVDEIFFNVLSICDAGR